MPAHCYMCLKMNGPSCLRDYRKRFDVDYLKGLLLFFWLQRTTCKRFSYRVFRIGLNSMMQQLLEHHGRKNLQRHFADRHFNPFPFSIFVLCGLSRPSPQTVELCSIPFASCKLSFSVIYKPGVTDLKASRSHPSRP